MAGEAWMGPTGILGALETALGLVQPTVPAGKQAAALLPDIETMGD